MLGEMQASASVLTSVTRDALAAVLTVAEQASRAIMAIYNAPERWAVTEKSDASPLTAADVAAHECIVHGLGALADTTLACLPVLSEESSALAVQARRDWPAYWLVDPLDGTKEFALVVGHEAVLGVVYGPASGVGYVAARGLGSFRIAAKAADERSSVMANATEGAALYWQRLQAVAPDWQAAPSALTLTVSRRHGLARLATFEQNLSAQGWQINSIAAGSAFKICAVAEGRAQAYPRFGPTSEWDTAAAQIVLEEAGGELVDSRGQRFCYNARNTLLNGDFIAVAGTSAPWLAHWPTP